MKNIIRGLVAGAIAIAVFPSCKKLDLTPYNQIKVTESFQTLKDAQSWDAGLYGILRGRVYGSYMISQDVQADQLNASLDYGNRNGSPHRWGDSFLADDGAITTAWGGYYYAITDVNVALAGFDNIATTSSTDAATLNKYRGDAYLARAYYYLNLVIRFAKPYESATASTDLGVPVLTKYDIDAMPSRATVKQVYDQIISDINNAKTFLANTAGAQGSRTFTIDAALALEARTRLYMQDWAGAYTAANTVITRTTYPLYNTAANFQAYWGTDAKQEDIVQLNANNTTEVPNVNNIYLGLLTNGSNTFAPDFIPSKWVVDFYSSTDIRKPVYFDPKTVVISGQTVKGIYLVNKYPGNISLFTGTYTNYYQAPKLFRVAELYLIAAEAAAKSGNAGNALTALNALKTARGVATVSSSGTTLIQDIKDERFRELAFEGFRLFDLKRYHEGFTRHDPQNTSIIQRGTSYDVLAIPADDNKFTWGLPTNDLIINTNLKQNPGW
ncbi:RagB/SusD family nutrient uptake outer membrane protein [Mucilaginibacter robiniae]|uniref:RagB/SusD family nutrient uptake outer membrane protein n=1 Tax=Mucilaginibacter robiniae TaxID=2728022 RepID=A0A7L5E4A6_9SPHI|nr:RagB/SusD family nutrient uptake outer membrane protein [Mucilaginibacter robiniae]QJD98152.1 RagB/SusD family nutrient uptake outer membrane protein [Mucilaginibacter robiniae]